MMLIPGRAVAAIGGRLRSLHREESGMLSLVTLFVVLVLLILIGFVTNTALVIKQKMETQNAADAVAYSAGVQMARGMNAVTATNHIIGELTALVVLHHGFGGDEMEEGKDRGDDDDRKKDGFENSPDIEHTIIEVAYTIALMCIENRPSKKTHDDVYEKGKQPAKVGAAVWDSKISIKRFIAGAYSVHALAAITQLVGVVVAVFDGGATYNVGRGMAAAARGFEEWLGVEWKLVTAIEKFARGTNTVKKLVRDRVVPPLHRVVALDRRLAATREAVEVGTDVAKAHHATMLLYPPRRILPLPNPFGIAELRLPVTEESLEELSETEINPRAQLVRASYPWVARWRRPIRQFTVMLFFSRFQQFYLKWTDRFALRQTKKLEDDKKVSLYVMEGRDDEPDKGNEDWTTDEDEADELFCLIGIAHRPESNLASRFVFGRPSPNGVAAYAQAMIYNANPQNKDQEDSQPIVGWDTLNWKGPVPEHPRAPDNDEPDYTFFEHIKGLVEVFTDEEVKPEIHLNWQAKLTPSTRMKDAIEHYSKSGGTDLERVLERTDPDALLHGH